MNFAEVSEPSSATAFVHAPVPFGSLTVAVIFVDVKLQMPDSVVAIDKTVGFGNIVIVCVSAADASQLFSSTTVTPNV